MSDGYQNRLAARFDALDRDGDGAITQADFEAMAREILASAGEPSTSARARRLIEAARTFFEGLSVHTDINMDGRIVKDEFLDAADISLRGNPRGFHQIAQPWAEAVIEIADRDQDGLVTHDEWAITLLAVGVDEELAERLPGLIDADGDGYITAKEILNLAVDFYTEDQALRPEFERAGV
ncbi:calcium-binding protein [Actinorhabdospora filicis]|uniref:Calcium-binding protein n=1 Tax=Actinorhabdospora filicis TaxID=1785913 RepID=A0A9W6WBD9_9ACTN|nr:EF-hand domain-containing protein [Actinorhabdospora filicis]GLZ79973.1 calcium-binding protein [Actinorhabdospora filicis]